MPHPIQWIADRSERFAPYVLVLWCLAAPLSTALAEILLGLAVALVLLRLLTRGPESARVPNTRWIRWALVLWGLFVLTYVVAVLTGLETGRTQNRLLKLFRYGLLLVPLVSVWREATWRAAFWIQLPLLAVLGAFGVQSLIEGSARAVTYNMHYNTLAQIAAMISLLLWAATLYGPATARRERIVFCVGAVLAAVLMGLTLGRAAWIAWWVGAVALLLFRLPRRVLLPVLLLMVIVPAALLPVVAARQEYFLDLSHPEFTRRYDIWRMGIDVIGDYPWTGVGPGGLDSIYDDYKVGSLIEDPHRWTHIHNDVISLGVHQGIPAAGIWVLLGGLFYAAFLRRLLRQRGEAGSWLLAGCVGAGASIHLFTMIGLVHENHPIYVKACTGLLLWGLFLASDRSLGRLPRSD